MDFSITDRTAISSRMAGASLEAERVVDDRLGTVDATCAATQRNFLKNTVVSHRPPPGQNA